MANIKSQKKRIITNEQSYINNKAKKSRINTEVRRFRQLVTEANFTGAEEQFKVVVSLIDRARLDNVYHQNTASHKKATLSRELFNARMAAEQDK